MSKITFASVGALLPYWGLYLQGAGYSAQQIATVFAILMGTKIIAPNIWGWLADHRGKRIGMIRLASLCSLLAFTGVFVSLDYGWVVLVTIVFSFFWNANLPQYEATTLAHLEEHAPRYSNIRLWGSLGFVLLVALLGGWFEQNSLNSLPYIISALLFGIWFFSQITPEAPMQNATDQERGFLPVIRQPKVIVFFILVFLLQASHGPYYAFYSIYLEAHSYGRTLIGQFWALGVIAEILIFLFMAQLLRHWRAEILIASSLVLATLRWWVIASFVDNFWLMLFAQILHAGSFGLFHAASMHLIHQYFPAAVQGRGQALYSSFSFGLGGALGAIYSGYTWDTLGAQWTYLIAAIISGVGTLIAIWYLKLSKFATSGIK